MARSRNKWKKYLVLLKSSRVAPHLPETHKLKKRHFRSMLEKYGSIVVKPVNGSGGAGVLFVYERDGGKKYAVQSGAKRKTYSSLTKAYRRVRRATKQKRIVQRKISLARIKNRPFDLRVMVQRKRGSSDWKVTGKLAKVAGPGYSVTNIRRSGGKVLPFDTAIRSSNIRNASASRIGRSVDRLSLAATRRLRKKYPIRICGLDVGLDRGGKAWIIEANFTPDITLFKKLKDRSMYRKIVKYSR